ncbi:NAD(P)/FAD-dependent oxidoreductase [Glycomyces xiaoerkulensis]|uniref:NAD(P)/FAD-dependent oxidoreductase n=1 Tax=Glycomyces xiaoerkulensis TaxID=2038139 RepID=UPI000C2691E9|nr:FAD-dependent oxidoreductase [Glycomyces xiaoerkulensis]
MKHRILVLGAGYAGVGLAGSLARRLHPAETEITLVNAEPDFVERIRLHQLAVGRDLPRRDLADVFAGTGVRVRIARVTAVDPERRTVAVHDDEAADELAYDTLVYALGSTADDGGVPGVGEHAFDIAGRASALRLREHLAGLGPGSDVLVAGGGLTGIEAATEIAETRPELEVALATRGEIGDWLAPKARRHLQRALDRLGVAVREHTPIERVEAERAVAADGTSLPAAATVWAAGFAVHSIAAAGGLEVADTGRIVADRTLRSVSHPEVYALGDSVHVIGENGRPLPMSCASAGFTRIQAADSIAARLTGRRVPTAKLRYVGNNIGLGRRDAVFQVVGSDLRPKSWCIRGRKAVALKNLVYRGTAWNATHPTAGPPQRRRRLAASDRTTAVAA